MERRAFLVALLATPTLVAILESCGSSSKLSSTNDGKPLNSTGGVARSNKGRADCACTSNLAVTTVNGLGIDLYHHLSTRSDGSNINLVFSPASIAVALSMTLAGAKAMTATQMDTVLHVADPAALPPSMNALTTGLGERTKSIKGPDGKIVDVTLAIANSLWAQKDMSFDAAFLDLLASQYDAGLQLVDYKKDPEAARVLINAWVDDMTKHRIKDLIPKGALTAQSRLTLVNAVYMKAPWSTPFSKPSTAPASFTTTAGATVTVPTMHVDSHFNYSKGSGWKAVELPYVGGDLSMLIVVPDSGGGASLDDAAAALPTLTSGSTSQQIKLSLPKFDIETATGLADVLSTMGMPTAFSDAADFTGMTTSEHLSIGAVIHQANITVDEDGTEAAAATAVLMTAGAIPAEPIDLTVDRPFVFAIRDNPTGAILFMGHIGDPSKTRSS